jgi:hypothetical protein
MAFLDCRKLISGFQIIDCLHLLFIVEVLPWRGSADKVVSLIDLFYISDHVYKVCLFLTTVLHFLPSSTMKGKCRPCSFSTWFLLYFSSILYSALIFNNCSTLFAQFYHEGEVQTMQFFYLFFFPISAQFYL